MYWNMHDTQQEASEGVFAVMRAVCDGALERLRVIAEDVCGLKYSKIATSGGWTPLQAAAMEGQTCILKFLLEQLTAAAVQRQLPQALLAAVAAGQLECIRVVLHHGVQPTPALVGKAILAAVEGGKQAALQMLLQHFGSYLSPTVVKEALYKQLQQSQSSKPSAEQVSMLKLLLKVYPTSKRSMFTSQKAQVDKFDASYTPDADWTQYYTCWPSAASASRQMHNKVVQLGYHYGHGGTAGGMAMLRSGITGDKQARNTVSLARVIYRLAADSNLSCIQLLGQALDPGRLAVEAQQALQLAAVHRSQPAAQALFSLSCINPEDIIRSAAAAKDMAAVQLFSEAAKAAGSAVPAGLLHSYMMAAVASGDLVTVSRMLETSGYKLQDQKDKGASLLHLAAYNGDWEITMLLAEAVKTEGVHPAVNSVCLESVLGRGIRSGQAALVQHWLGSPSCRLQQKQNLAVLLMQTAVQHEQWQMLRLLCRAGADINAACDASGRTLLHHAAMCDAASTVQQLLSKGAAVGSTDQAGDTALHLACSAGQRQNAVLLIEAGARINARNSSEMTSVHMAARAGHAQVIAGLLQYGTQAWAGAQLANATAVQLAAEGGHAAAMELLLKAVPADCRVKSLVIAAQAAAAGKHMQLFVSLAKQLRANSPAAVAALFKGRTAVDYVIAMEAVLDQLMHQSSHRDQLMAEAAAQKAAAQHLMVLAAMDCKAQLASRKQLGTREEVELLDCSSGITISCQVPDQLVPPVATAAHHPVGLDCLELLMQQEQQEQRQFPGHRKRRQHGPAVGP